MPGDQNSSSRGLSLVSELSDGDVVRRVLAGDGEAYAVLVARYRHRFARYALHMLGDREEAEEALQDAFVRAWRGLGRCRNPDRFDAWLFQILANRCRTRGGRRRRHDAIFVQQEHAIASAQACSTAPPDPAEWSEAVHRALAALEPDQREAFLLKYVDELSYEEMESLTGIGVSALKMRVKRAADRLRLLLPERAHAQR
jgi:RNA polymerase sigma-70 factor (ECF subfamily)